MRILAKLLVTASKIEIFEQIYYSCYSYNQKVVTRKTSISKPSLKPTFFEV